MEQQERIRLLLSLQEHPERYTNEQIIQMLADDPQLAELMEELAMTKRAFAKQEADKEDLPMDDLWKQFASEHEEELNALEPQQEKESINHPILGLSFGNILGMAKQHVRAAVFLGIVLTAGFAFAAIHIVRHLTDSESVFPETGIENPLQQEQIVTDKRITTDSTKTDTTMAIPTAVSEPIVFDNVSLDEMLSQIAAYYQAEVSFQNESARQLRFYFVWKREDGLEHAIDKLNRFESLSVRLEEKNGEHLSSKIIVE